MGLFLKKRKRTFPCRRLTLRTGRQNTHRTKTVCISSSTSFWDFDIQILYRSADFVFLHHLQQFFVAAIERMKHGRIDADCNARRTFFQLAIKSLAKWRRVRKRDAWKDFFSISPYEYSLPAVSICSRFSASIARFSYPQFSPNVHIHKHNKSFSQFL